MRLSDSLLTAAAAEDISMLFSLDGFTFLLIGNFFSDDDIVAILLGDSDPSFC